MKRRILKHLPSFVALVVIFFSACSISTEVKEVDICIYGGTSAGVIAAYTAKQMEKNVLLIEPRQNLGGMSSGGLGYTDIGNKYVVKGLALDFYRKIGSHYGNLEQWIFEPSVAEKIFNDYINKANVEVWYGRRLRKLKTEDGIIHQLTLEDTYKPSVFTNQKVKAKVYIDCSYEGDLMAKAGVSYAIGRESNELYGETYNGVQLLDGHQFQENIDPYIVPGDTSSGLLWGVNDTELQEKGAGDKKVQTYNFRICLTNREENKIPITKPANYDPLKYELLVRINEKKPFENLSQIFIWSRMPNEKTDINNRGAFSTDMIGGNWNYPEADYTERDKIWQEHVDYTKGLLYFVGHDERMPQTVRDEMLQWGYPKDEYLNNNHWSHQLYIREARRMIGETVMTQHHCQGRESCDDPVGWAAYTMDSHNCDRLIVNGVVRNEGNVEVGGFGPYPVSYKAIIPKRNEITNLLVPVCLSASHIAYGSIRMEPVFMVLAQSSAVAACLAIDNHKNIVQDIDYTELQAILTNNPLADYSTPEILVDNDNEERVKLQGEWKTVSSGSYGTNYFLDDSQGKPLKSVRYMPDIKYSGKYRVYFYYPKINGVSDNIYITLSNGKQTEEREIKTSDIVILGQTSGEWVSLGEFFFNVEDDSHIEFSNKKANGKIIADAVLLIP